MQGQGKMRLGITHLGDLDICKALVFVDKYKLTAHFCKPIVDFLDVIPFLSQIKDPNEYICSIFAGLRELKIIVLADYFMGVLALKGS